MDKIFCQRCNKKLNPKKIVWLEYDQRTGTYTDQGVPAEFSQGGFEFGSDCAKVEIARHKAAQVCECGVSKNPTAYGVHHSHDCPAVRFQKVNN
jgi:hypothetical protein